MANVSNLGLGAGVGMGVKKKKKKDLGIGAGVMPKVTLPQNTPEAALASVATSYLARTGHLPSPDKALPVLTATLNAPAGGRDYHALWEAFDTGDDDYDPVTGEGISPELKATLADNRDRVEPSVYADDLALGMSNADPYRKYNEDMDDYQQRMKNLGIDRVAGTEQLQSTELYGSMYEKEEKARLGVMFPESQKRDKEEKQERLSKTLMRKEAQARKEIVDEVVETAPAAQAEIISKGFTPLTTVRDAERFAKLFRGKTRDELRREGKLDAFRELTTQIALAYPELAEHYDNEHTNVVWDNYFDARVKGLLGGRAMAYALFGPTEAQQKQAKRVISWATEGEFPADGDLYSALSQYNMDTKSDKLVLSIYRGFVRGRPTSQTARVAREEYVKLFGVDALPAKALEQYEADNQNQAQRVINAMRRGVGRAAGAVWDAGKFVIKLPYEIPTEVFDVLAPGEPIEDMEDDVKKELQEFYDNNETLRAVGGALSTARDSISDAFHATVSGVARGVGYATTNFAEAYEWYDEMSDQALTTLYEVVKEEAKGIAGKGEYADAGAGWGAVFSAEAWTNEWQKSDHKELVNTIFSDIGFDMENNKAAMGIAQIADFVVDGVRDFGAGRAMKLTAGGLKELTIDGARLALKDAAGNVPAWTRTLAESVSHVQQKNPMMLKALFNIHSDDIKVNEVVEKIAASTDTDEVIKYMNELDSFGIDIDPGVHWLVRQKRLQRLTAAEAGPDARKAISKILDYGRTPSYDGDHAILRISRATKMGRPGTADATVSKRAWYWANEYRVAQMTGDLGKMRDVWDAWKLEIRANLETAACPSDVRKIVKRMTGKEPANALEGFEQFTKIKNARTMRSSKLEQANAKVTARKRKNMALPGIDPDDPTKIIDLAKKSPQKVRQSFTKAMEIADDKLAKATKAKDQAAMDAAALEREEARVGLETFNANPSSYRPARQWQIGDELDFDWNTADLGLFLLSRESRMWQLTNHALRLDKIAAFQRMMVTTTLSFPMRVVMSDEAVRLLFEKEYRMTWASKGARQEYKAARAELRDSEAWRNTVGDALSTFTDTSEYWDGFLPTERGYALRLRGQLEGDAKEAIVREWAKHPDADTAKKIIRELVQSNTDEGIAIRRFLRDAGWVPKNTSVEFREFADDIAQKTAKLTAEREAVEAEIQQLKAATTLDAATDSIIKKYADEFRGYPKKKKGQQTFLDAVDNGADLPTQLSALRHCLHRISGGKSKDLKKLAEYKPTNVGETEEWLNFWFDKLENEYDQIPAFREYIRNPSKGALPSEDHIQALVDEGNTFLRPAVGARPGPSFGMKVPIMSLANEKITSPLMKFIGDRVKLAMASSHYDSILKRLERTHGEMDIAERKVFAAEEAMRAADAKMYTPNFSLMSETLKPLVMFLPAYRQFAKYWSMKFADNPILLAGIQHNIEPYVNRSYNINLPFTDWSPTVYAPPVPFWSDSGSREDTGMGSTANFLMSSVVGPTWNVIMPLRLTNYVTKKRTGEYALDEWFDKIAPLSFAKSDAPMISWLDDMFYGITGTSVGVFQRSKENREKMARNLLFMQLSNGLKPNLTQAVNEIADKPWYKEAFDHFFFYGLTKLASPVGASDWVNSDVENYYNAMYEFNTVRGDSDAEEKVLKKYPKFAKVQEYYDMTPAQQEKFLLDEKNAWIVPHLVSTYHYDKDTKRPITSAEWSQMVKQGKIKMREFKEMAADAQSMYDLINWNQNLEKLEARRQKELEAGKKRGQELARKRAGTSNELYQEYLKDWNQSYQAYSGESDRFGYLVERANSGWGDDAYKYQPYFINKKYENLYRSILYGNRTTDPFIKKVMTELRGELVNLNAGDTKFMNQNIVESATGKVKLGDGVSVEMPTLEKYLAKNTIDYSVSTSQEQKLAGKDKLYSYFSMVDAVSKLVPESEQAWYTSDFPNVEGLKREMEAQKTYNNRQFIKMAGEDRWNIDAATLRDLGFHITRPKMVQNGLDELQRIYYKYKGNTDRDAVVARRKEEAKVLARPYMAPLRGGVAQRLLNTTLARPNWTRPSYKQDKAFITKSMRLMTDDWTPDLNPVTLAVTKGQSVFNADNPLDAEESRRAAAWAGVLSAAMAGRAVLAKTPNEYYDGYPGVSPTSKAAGPTVEKLKRYVREWMTVSPEFTKQWKWLSSQITYGESLYEKLLSGGN